MHGPHPTIPNISISVIFNDALSSYDYVTWVINEWVWSNGGNMLKREKYDFWQGKLVPMPLHSPEITYRLPTGRVQTNRLIFVLVFRRTKEDSLPKRSFASNSVFRYL